MNQGISSLPKRTVYGKFAEGHMIGGIYKLEQGATSFMTMFDHNRYIILEEGRGLRRWYILTQQGIPENHQQPADSANQSIFYKLVHYVVPSVPESSRVKQLSNKRSIDRDIKEFFAIKNTAH